MFNKHSFIGRLLRQRELRKKVDASWRNACVAESGGNKKRASREFSKHIRYTNLERPGTWRKAQEDPVQQMETKTMQSMDQLIRELLDENKMLRQQLSESELLAGCTDMLYQDLLAAKVITATVPPMMMSDAVLSKIRAMQGWINILQSRIPEDQYAELKRQFGDHND